MAILIKREINRKDWKNFIKWINEEKYFFKNKEFFTKLFSLNRNFNLESKLIEFYLYNKFILENRYSFDWPIWLTQKKADNIEKFIKSLFDEFFKEKELNKLFDVYFEIVKYQQDAEKNVDHEYEIALKYNDIIKKIREKNIDDYNKWIIYINKHIHINLKGFK